MKNLRDVMRGWREAIMDEHETIYDIIKKLSTLANAIEQKNNKITKKTIAKQICDLSDELINIQTSMRDVGNDMYDAARGKINNYYQPKIVRRMPLGLEVKAYSEKLKDKNDKS